MARRDPTKTSTFGVSRRESHDASLYYARSLFKVETDHETLAVCPDPAVYDRLICGSAEDMSDLADNSVGLAITSPPYHVGKEYDTDVTFEEYLELLERSFSEVYRVLEPGGRFCVNVAGLGRSPYVPLDELVGAILRDLKFLYRGKIIWIKAKGANGNAAWGSWCSPSNPTLRDLHEFILVFSKMRFKRARRGKGTIAGGDFMRNTLSVWEMRPESAKRIGHPAPFPIELPQRCIELYAYEDDLILDPFMGAGATALAARSLGRPFVGYDTDQTYLDIAARRLGELDPPDDEATEENA